MKIKNRKYLWLCKVPQDINDVFPMALWRKPCKQRGRDTQCVDCRGECRYRLVRDPEKKGGRK